MSGAHIPHRVVSVALDFLPRYYNLLTAGIALNYTWIFGSISSTLFKEGVTAANLCSQLFVILIDGILKHTQGLERVQFDDIRSASAICK